MIKNDEKFSVIIPGIKYDAHIKKIVSILNKYRKYIGEIIIVVKKLNSKLKNNESMIIQQEYPGPGGAWSTGVKSAKYKNLWFISSDIETTIINLSHLDNILKKLKTSPFIQGDFSKTLIQTRLAKVESYMDTIRLNRNVRQIIDYRNFFARKGDFNQILDKYFFGKYACDAELEIALLNEKIIVPVYKEGPIIYNIYPSTFKKALIRKFKHGCYMSEIISSAKFLQIESYSPKHFKRLKRYLTYSINFNGNLFDKLCFFILGLTFICGMIFGEINPKMVLKWYPSTLINSNLKKYGQKSNRIIL